MKKIVINSYQRRLSSGKEITVKKHLRRLSISTLETSFNPGVRNALNVSLGIQGEHYVMHLLRGKGFTVKRVGHLTSGIGDLIVGNTLSVNMNEQRWLVEVKAFFDREKQKDGNKIVFRRSRPQINIKAHRSMELYAKRIKAKPIYAFIIVNNKFDGTLSYPLFRFSMENVYFLSSKIINRQIDKSRSVSNIKLGRKIFSEKFDFSLKKE